MRKRQRGYTAVEILSAMTLFAIGAAGVIGMQKVSINGGTDARRYDVGSNLANEWLYRLQRDASFWTLPNDYDRTTQNIDQTKWLKDLYAGTAGCTGASYCLPAVPTAAGQDSPAADVLGRDAVSGSGDHFYCTQYRLNWIANPWSTASGCTAAGTSQEPCITGLIRAEVRVFWRKLEKNPIGACAGVNPDSAPNDYHFVYAASTVRQNSNYPDSGQ